jgi:hypothetical protein
MKTALFAAFMPLVLLAAALSAPLPQGPSTGSHHQDTDGNPWHSRSAPATKSVDRDTDGAWDPFSMSGKATKSVESETAPVRGRGTDRAWDPFSETGKPIEGINHPDPRETS